MRRLQVVDERLYFFFVRFLLFRSGRLGMTGPRLLNGIRQAPQVVPTGGDMDRLTERRLDPVCDLLARPFPFVVWR